MCIGSGHCTLKPKAIQSFCCHDKALEYDEYDTLLKEAEPQGEKCLTAHEEFKANMLSEGVLKIDHCLYLEDNWLMENEDLEKIKTLWTSDISTMFALSISNFGKKKQKAMHFLRVFTRKSETSLGRLMAFILI